MKELTNDGVSLMCIPRIGCGLYCQSSCLLISAGCTRFRPSTESSTLAEKSPVAPTEKAPCPIVFHPINTQAHAYGAGKYAVIDARLWDGNECIADSQHSRDEGFAWYLITYEWTNTSTHTEQLSYSSAELLPHLTSDVDTAMSAGIPQPPRPQSAGPYDLVDPGETNTLEDWHASHIDPPPTPLEVIFTAESDPHRSAALTFKLEKVTRKP